MIYNERIKLFAIYLNTMAAGAFVAGGLGALASAVINGHADMGIVTTLVLGAIGLSIFLHLVALAVLGLLK